MVINTDNMTAKEKGLDARRVIFQETLPTRSGLVPELEVTVRSLVRTKPGDEYDFRVEWSALCHGWKEAWSVVDDCCFPRRDARVWCPAQLCEEANLADDLYVPPNKLSGWWIIDLR